MKSRDIATTLASLIFLVACTSPNSSNGSDNKEKDNAIEVEADPNLDGFILVHSKGKHTLLGTNLKEAAPKERPQMKVEFSYDYSLERNEVTCGDFNETMKSGGHLQIVCAGEDLPVNGVSFYDAILFANAKSKELKKDTAYSYTSATYDANGSCTNMEGYVFHPEADAYRLPTEAEWSLAASINWNPSKEWNVDNSNYELHDICTADNVTEDSFCDMAGNVMEWVNDWMGGFRDTTVTDYVGAPDGGSLGQRIIKGGSYLHSPTSANLYNRGDVYTVTSASKAEYVGFRLAYGKIPEAVWLSNNGSVSYSQLSLLVNSATIKSHIGTRRAKLAFRNDDTHNLAFINFSAAGTPIEEIVDTVNVYHPDISPDGKWVAFCTGLEGIDGKSSLYVRELSTSSKLIKLNASSAAIPRWRINDGDTTIVYVTNAAHNDDNGNFKKMSTWQVSFTNGKFGKPQKLFDGNYHGGISNDNRMAISGSTLLRARVAQKGDIFQSDALDTVWYNEEQACNASLAKDDTKRTVFLDFSGKTGRDFVGEKYSTHKRLLVADSTGKLIQSVAAPKGFTFDHSEWVSRIGYPEDSLVVATLTNGEGAHRRITLVNLKDSSTTDLVEGDEIWHPALWTASNSGVDSNIDLDSAGLYFDENGGSPVVGTSVELAMKMAKFWQGYKDAEYMSFGSSMTNNAIYDDSIKVYKSLNMAVALADIHFALYIIQNYAMRYAKHLKVISIELSPGLLYRSKDEVWEPIKASAPGFLYDESHLQDNLESISKIAVEKEYPKALLPLSYIDGTFLVPSSSWDKAEVPFDVSTMSFDNAALQKNFDELKAFDTYARKNGIAFFMTITPRSPGYKETEAFGYFGPGWDVAKEIIEKIKGLGIPVFDEYNYGDHDYTDKMACGSFHLSYLGAYQFTRRLDAFLEKLVIPGKTTTNE